MNASCIVFACIRCVRKQLGTKNSKGNEGRQEKNGGVKGRDGSAEERLVRGRLQWAGHVERMADDRLPKLRERQSYLTRAGGDEGDQG